MQEEQGDNGLAKHSEGWTSIILLQCGKDKSMGVKARPHTFGD